MSNKCKVNIIIVEGPDCSGKTTQIGMLAKELKNCLVIHHPKKSYAAQDILAITAVNIYSPDLKLDSESSKQDFINSAVFNALNNYRDKQGTLDFINDLFCINSKRCIVKWIDMLKNPEDVKAYYNGEYLNISECPDENKRPLVELFELAKNKSEEFYIIFDRFALSGDCYNNTLVNLRWMELRSWELTTKDMYIKELDNRELDSTGTIIMHKLMQLKNTIEGREIQEYINSVPADYVDVDPDIFNIVFRSSELLREQAKTDSGRKIDAYDKNSFISIWSANYFNDQRWLGKFNLASQLYITPDAYYGKPDILHEHIMTKYYSHMLERSKREEAML